ncbi:MAG: 4Fe-4S binding protein [Erysipelotrichaceae bacterium]|nr:4Fe-4S binding protein [Erysipelotrichaceae bacterium]
MKREIITIDEKKCDGCGLCVDACHEGAIELVDGKAKLVREHFCDGLGDCLPNCPQGAISFETREAPAYDKEAVEKAQREKKEAGCACPGSQPMFFEHRQSGMPAPILSSQLGQWPCQIKLVPVQAPFFDQAKLLVAADCTAYAYANMHERFMKGKVTLIGCPKLDGIDYSEKLTGILSLNEIREVCIVRMEVPCCGGLEMAVKTALQNSGKFIPWQVVTITRDGQILE